MLVVRPVLKVVVLFCALMSASQGVLPLARADAPEFESRPIFAPEDKHNHASCVIETAGGDLFATWYSGSGERRSDDVVIQGAWLKKGASQWEPRFLLADTPGYPDCNPAVFTAPDGAIWLFWPTILDHRWEGALLKFAVSEPGANPSRPLKWSREGVVHITPGSDFPEAITRSLAALTHEQKERYKRELEPFEARSKDLLYQRLGWMPRVHPVILSSGRWILPLYTDTFSVSIMAISDDQGKTWKTSRPIEGFGNIQPSLVEKKNGTLVAFMRDNGPRRRILMSTSADKGTSWTPSVASDFPNPGAGIEAIRLSNGHWVLIYNDQTRGRHTLAVSLSDDEGRNWKVTRHLERHEVGQGSYHYPSLSQTRDGALHATYTHRPTGKGSTIMHARFNEAWILAGDGKP